MYQKRKLPAPCNIRVQICWHICNKILKRKAQLIWFCMTKKIKDYKLTLEHQYLQERNLYQLRGLYIGAKPFTPPPSPRGWYFSLFPWYDKTYSSSIPLAFFCPSCIYFTLLTKISPFFFFLFFFYFTFSSFFSSIFSYFPPPSYIDWYISPQQGGGVFSNIYTPASTGIFFQLTLCILYTR
jgi:hypothetical protein